MVCSVVYGEEENLRIDVRPGMHGCMHIDRHMTCHSFSQGKASLFAILLLQLWKLDQVEEGLENDILHFRASSCDLKDAYHIDCTGFSSIRSVFRCSLSEELESS